MINFKDKNFTVGIIGLGYVGLPLMLEFIEEDIKVIGFDIDLKKVNSLNRGESYIRHISSDKIKKTLEKKLFHASSNFSELKGVDAILICVPTPLNKQREPDISYITSTANNIRPHLKKDHLVILESSTYPGTTEELLKSILEESGLFAHKDFFLGFSPEREDPNNPDFTTRTIPKVVGANSEGSLERAVNLYSHIIDKVVPVSSSQAAEATKLLENIFRSVNIALVNEMKMILDKMNIDVWEVIEAASTKPFGFMPFYPGPGLGGHCIPIDPFYMTWKAREYEMPTKFIELAGEINTNMPFWVVNKCSEALNSVKKSINGSKILIIGMAYKKNVDDMRESPSLKLMELLKERGAEIDYYDSYIPEIPKTRKYNYSLKSIKLSKESIQLFDLTLLSTNHDNVDYELIYNNSQLIVDTRNVFTNKNQKLFKG
jgi:UDP-N-acetyl-D-glucosamine dehydrogenase